MSEIPERENRQVRRGSGAEGTPWKTNEMFFWFSVAFAAAWAMMAFATALFVRTEPNWALLLLPLVTLNAGVLWGKRLAKR